jgi:hypothetical protein
MREKFGSESRWVFIPIASPVGRASGLFSCAGAPFEMIRIVISAERRAFDDCFIRIPPEA